MSTGAHLLQWRRPQARARLLMSLTLPTPSRSVAWLGSTDVSTSTALEVAAWWPLRHPAAPPAPAVSAVSMVHWLRHQFRPSDAGGRRRRRCPGAASGCCETTLAHIPSLRNLSKPDTVVSAAPTATVGAPRCQQHQEAQDRPNQPVSRRPIHTLSMKGCQLWLFASSDCINGRPELLSVHGF